MKKLSFLVMVCGFVLVAESKAQAQAQACDLSRIPGNYSESRGGQCVIHRPHGAPEMSAATYRAWAYDAYKKGNYKRECQYLKQAVNAVEPGIPAKKSGSLSRDCRWDYNREIATIYQSNQLNGIWCPGKGPGNQTCDPY